MKEDVSAEDEGTSLSKIFKELAKLEKDFRYQETLYKIKTDELEKAAGTNRIIKEHLETAYAEIESLRIKLQTFEVGYRDLESGCTQEKEFCEQVVQKLTTKITVMTNEHKSLVEKQEAHFKQSQAELQDEHNLFVNELQRKHGEALIELEHELNQETNHSRQLQSKLDFTIEDNLLLQDKLRKVHQEYLPLEAYKTQLKSVSAANEKMKTQCLHMKTECQTLLNENAHLQKHNDRLNQFVCKNNDQQKLFEATKKEQHEVMLKIQSQLNEMIVQGDLLKGECEQLRKENSKLSLDLEHYKGDYCNVEMHRNISEQNQILQELVKDMRKERMKCTGDQLQSNLDETEERIKRLEELIQELKKCAMSTKKHCIRRKHNGSSETGTLPVLR